MLLCNSRTSQVGVARVLSSTSGERLAVAVHRFVDAVMLLDIDQASRLHSGQRRLECVR